MKTKLKLKRSYIDGLAQGFGNSNAVVMELGQSYARPPK